MYIAVQVICARSSSISAPRILISAKNNDAPATCRVVWSRRLPWSASPRSHSSCNRGELEIQLPSQEANVPTHGPDRQVLIRLEQEKRQDPSNPHYISHHTTLGILIHPLLHFVGENLQKIDINPPETSIRRQKLVSLTKAQFQNSPSTSKVVRHWYGTANPNLDIIRRSLRTKSVQYGVFLPK